MKTVAANNVVGRLCVGRERGSDEPSSTVGLNVGSAREDVRLPGGYRMTIHGASDDLGSEIAPRGTALSCVPLFQRECFTMLHRDVSIRALVVRIYDGKGEHAGIFSCHEQEAGAWVSPGRGSFGGIYLREGARTLELLEAIFDAIESHILSVGGGRLQLALAAQAHDQGWDAIVMNVLMRRGYQISCHDLSYARTILSEPFAALVSRGNLKNIRRAARRGYHFSELDDSDLGLVYGIIERNRARRGFPMTMTLAAMQMGSDTIPDHFRLFGVEVGKNLVAAAVCVPINRSVLYVFYWAEIEGVENPSPIPTLAEGLYDYGRREGFCLLDVGTSTVRGVPNLGLIRFKESLGFRPSLKLVMAANL